MHALRPQGELDAVLKGVEWAALSVANDTLIAAEAAVDNLITRSEYTLWQAARWVRARCSCGAPGGPGPAPNRWMELEA